MGFIPSLVSAALTYFKVNPRTAARVIAEAIGWLYVGLNVADAVIPKAIELLKAVLVGLGTN